MGNENGRISLGYVTFDGELPDPKFNPNKAARVDEMMMSLRDLCARAHEQPIAPEPPAPPDLSA